MIYNINDWYWIVGSDSTKVFSSKRTLLVDISDAEYTLWLSYGNSPTSINSQTDLNDVLNAPIIAEIEKLELTQLRPLRELALGDITAADRIADINTHIALLRATLHK